MAKYHTPNSRRKLKRLLLAVAAAILLGGSSLAQRGPGRGPVGPERDPEMEVTQKHNLQVARWYLTKRKAYEGARDRLQEILDADPEFSQIDEVVYLLGEANEKLRKPEIASNYYRKVIKDYPGSQFTKKARERLAELKLPTEPEDEKSRDKEPDKKPGQNTDPGPAPITQSVPPSAASPHAGL